MLLYSEKRAKLHIPLYSQLSRTVLLQYLFKRIKCKLCQSVPSPVGWMTEKTV